MRRIERAVGVGWPFCYVEMPLGEPGGQQAIAASLFRERSLSLGLAAKFSGLGVAGFIQHVSRLGIPVVSGTADTVKADADVAETWQKGSS